MNDHRKFLKSVNTTYEIGEYIPMKIQLFQNKDSIDMSWIHDTLYGSTLFFLSSGCKACDIEPIKKTIEKYPEFNYAVFYEGPTRENEEYCIENKVLYYYCDLAKIEKELFVKVAPFQLVVNKVGQVVNAGVCNHEEHIENLLLPLTRTLIRNQL